MIAAVSGRSLTAEQARAMAANRKTAVRTCRLHNCSHRHCSACGKLNCPHQSRIMPAAKFLGTANKLFCCPNHAKLAHHYRRRRTAQEVTT